MPASDAPDDPTQPIRDALLALARGDLDARVPLELYDSDDSLAGIAAGINMLAEELGASMASRDRAEADELAKGRFLTHMSHELRTPLTSIIGFSELIQSEDLGWEQARTWGHAVHRNASHLLALINDVLDLSRIEADQFELDLQDCSVPSILAELQSVLTPLAAERGLRLIMALDGGVPDRVVSDPRRIRQVLFNLIGNAIKFTQQGEVTVVASTQRLRDRSTLRIDVTDTGVGIDPVDIERLFAPFAQADVAGETASQGTGLGLTISRKLAHLLGAELTAVSELGRGSTFSLTLELGSEADLGPLVTELAVLGGPEVDTESIGDSLSGTRILVAEDGPDNRRLIEWFLNKAGADLTFAQDGEEAVDAALAPNAAFDIVLMDMQMPRVDGYEAVRRLREAGFEAPVVALTAHAIADTRERCVAAGCSDYLSKPFEGHELIRLVLRHVGPGPTAPNTGSIQSALATKLKTLTALFLEQLPDRVGALRDAVDGRDEERIQHLAHQLLGAAGTFGFPDIGDLSGLIEDAVGADPGVLKDHLRDLEDEVRRLQADPPPAA